MTTTYRVDVADPLGTHLTSVAGFVEAEGHGLDYVLNVGRIGVLTMTVPANIRPDIFTPDRLLDGRLGVWRSINGQSEALDGDAIFLPRIFEYTTDLTTIIGLHVNELFARRIVAYNSGTSYTSKAATFADNLVKTFIKENMGASIVNVDRDGSDTYADISAYVSTASNLSRAASIAKEAARRILAEVILELAQASTNAGTYLATEIVSAGGTSLEARTYTTARGVNRSSSSTRPYTLSEENGRLRNAKLRLDYSREVTFAIAAGAGVGANRLIATASDGTRIVASPFNRREQYIDMGNCKDTTQLQNAANAAVRAGRPDRVLTADLQETPSAIRGIHFDLGDIVVQIGRAHV